MINFDPEKRASPKEQAKRKRAFQKLAAEIKKQKKKKAPKAPKGVFVDPDSVTPKQLVRIDDWALKIMSKHEHLFSDDVPLGKVFIEEAMKPEDVDIPQIYDFSASNLRYQIFRKMDSSWAVRIMQDNRMIVEAAYLKE